MSFVTWKCAKTVTPLAQETVHLYLPGGQRIVGLFNGCNKILVKEALAPGNSISTRVKIDPERSAWAKNAGGRNLDIFVAVGGQLVFGLESRDDVFSSDNYAEILESIKLVSDDAFDRRDTFDKLPASQLVTLTPGTVSVKEISRHVMSAAAPVAIHAPVQ